MIDIKCLLPLSFNFSSQLLAVKDADGNAVECYAYDKAGNMLKKTVGGKKVWGLSPKSLGSVLIWNPP